MIGDMASGIAVSRAVLEAVRPPSDRISCSDSDGVLRSHIKTVASWARIFVRNHD
jgi:hypothetical protein